MRKEHLPSGFTRKELFAQTVQFNFLEDWFLEIAPFVATDVVVWVILLYSIPSFGNNAAAVVGSLRSLPDKFFKFKSGFAWFRDWKNKRGSNNERVPRKPSVFHKAPSRAHSSSSTTILAAPQLSMLLEVVPVVIGVGPRK